MFKDRLKYLRIKINMSQSAIGKLIGVSASTIGMYEQGRRYPSHDSLIKLSTYFKVTTDYLLDANNHYNIGNNLKHLRTLSGYSLDELAKEINIYTQELESYETNELPISDFLLGKITFELCVSKYDFLEGRYLEAFQSSQEDPNSASASVIENIETFDSNDVAKIPIYVTIPARDLSLAVASIEGYDYVLKNDNVTDPNNYFYLKVKGDSMNNARILEGDLVLVRKQSDVDNRDIAVIMINGDEATLRRIIKVDNTIMLQPESSSPQHQAKIITQDLEFSIIGKVVSVKFNL